MKKLLIIILIISSNIVNGFDFVVPDTLKYHGKSYAVTSEPLAILFDKYPLLRPKSDLVTIGQEKHYEAEFIIVKEQLYLTAIIVMKHDSLQGNFIPVNIIRDIFCCDTVNMNWLTITMDSIDGSGTRIFDFYSGKLISTKWIRYYGDYLLFLDKFIQEFKTNDSITYNVLDEIYKSRGMNNFRNVVELNFVNIFAICSRLDLTMLEAALVGGYH
jgi:hypothetical protein